jgi:hypothetical protein
VTIKALAVCTCGAVLVLGAEWRHLRAHQGHDVQFFLPDLLVCATCRREIPLDEVVVHAATEHDEGWLAKLADGSLRAIER